MLTQAVDGRCREHDVANLTEADQEQAPYQRVSHSPLASNNGRSHWPFLWLDGGLVDEHHRDIVFDWIDALAGGALESCAVLHGRDRSFTVWAGQNLEELRI